jgi:hypothetical protein
VLDFQRQRAGTAAGQARCGPADGVIGPRTWRCLVRQN